MLRTSILGTVLILLLAVSAPAQKQPPAPKPASPADIEFFEKSVRPVLAENCFSCHSGNEPLGGLRLDQPAAIFKGGSHGPSVVPGSPEKSLLIRAIRHAPGVSAMPPSGKLSGDKVRALEEWVRRGAPIPKATPVVKATANGFPLAERRKLWSYQPVKRPPVPRVKAASWVRNPIDAFLLARMEADSLTPAPTTDKRALIRRVTFDLTGLPPTPAEVNAFLADTSPKAYETVVERLLASPHYGERWGRHWLDLMRYGESLGHEFDYNIHNAYQYRDYVIRAFNADVPYDRLIMEHFAGDLLPNPRRDAKTGRNESLLGTGFFWLGEGKHSPVDIRQEQADRMDNQIDVIGKAFLAQTVSCARCHDHKFDPIPTKDYYALYGILKSSRYQQAHVDAPETFAKPARELDAAHASINRAAGADAWKASLNRLSDTALQEAANTRSSEGPPGQVLAPLSDWKATGEAFATSTRVGDLVLTGDGTKTVFSLAAKPVAHSARQSRFLEGALRSPTFTIDKDFLHLKLSGKDSRFFIVVENFYLICDPIYGPLAQGVGGAQPEWRTLDLSMWKGRRAYVELSDSGLSTHTPSPGVVVPPESVRANDGWICLEDARLSDSSKPPAAPNLLTGKPVAEIRAALQSTLERWQAGDVGDADRDALAAWNILLRNGSLDTTPLAETASRIAAIDATIPAPTRAPAIVEGMGENERVFVRGSHKTLGDIAPRLALATCNTETVAPTATGSGRLELAKMIASPSHPLTARVMVNRLWKHHFGTGLVASTDDFGWMGQRPTHPELLDWLASEFVRQGWSIKRMHRLMVLSSAYRMSSAATDPVAEKKDPKNVLLHRMAVRRLEAEGVRDSLLAVSGELYPTLYGPSILNYMPGELDGRGSPGNGPLDGNRRRTIYLAVRRNYMSSFLLAFDFPTPFTTIGRRNVSNVPAQALALMNGEFVREMAKRWAKRSLESGPKLTPAQRVTHLYATAYGRPPSPGERQALIDFLAGRDDTDAWTDVCHTLFNLKEFIYVR